MIHVTIEKITRQGASFIIAGIIMGSIALSQPNLNFKRITVSWPRIDLSFQVGCNGLPAYNFSKANIRVFENGLAVDSSHFTLFIKNPALHTPVSLSLVFDASLHMAGGGFAIEKQDGHALINLMDSTVEEASIISFGDQVGLLAGTTRDKTLLHAGIDALALHGASKLLDGVFGGLNELQQHAGSQCKSVVLFSNGYELGSAKTTDELVSFANRYAIRIYCIGVGNMFDTLLLQALALQTGGRYYPDAAAPGLPDTLYKHIAADAALIQDCTVSYFASCTDGSTRMVDLELNNFCSGSDMKTKIYRAPKDTTTLNPITIRLGSAVAKTGGTVIIPLELLTPLGNDYLYPASFDVLFDKSIITINTISTPSGSLLAGVPVSAAPIPGGMSFYITQKKLISGSGKLADLSFTTGTIEDSTTLPLDLTNWQFTAGCFRPILEDGEIAGSARQMIECSVTHQSTLDFGKIEPGQSATRTVFIRNLQKQDLRVSSCGITGAQASEFLMWPHAFPFTVWQGMKDSVVLSYSTGNIGASAAMLTIASDDPFLPGYQINLTGVCIPHTKAPRIQCSLVDSAFLDFGTVMHGYAATRKVIVTNGGDDVLQVRNLQVSGGNVSDFSITSGSGNATLAPLQSDTLVLNFSPPVIGPRNGVLTIGSNDPAKPMYTIRLYGVGDANDFEFGSDAAVLDFGAVRVGRDSVRVVHLFNTGKQAMSVLSQEIIGNAAVDFMIGRPCGTLIPSESGDSIALKFVPASGGGKQAELQIKYIAFGVQTLTIPLSGTGMTGDAPSALLGADTLDFGMTQPNAPVLRTLSVTNTGLQLLDLQSQTISGADKADFSANSSLPVSVPGATIRQLDFAFTPQSLGIKTAVLTLNSNDPVKPQRTVVLLGSCVSSKAATISSSVTTLDFGHVQVMTAKTDSITITNTGGIGLMINAQNIIGADFTHFGIVVPTAVIIPPLTSGTVVLKFSPLTTGTKTAVYRVLSNDPINPQFDVTLTGNSVTATEDLQPVTGSPVLEQSYPNPVSISGGATASIRYTLDTDAFTTLKLYDVLGRYVATIYAGRTAAGAHTVRLTRERFGSVVTPGIYRYTLTAGDKVVSRSMVVQ